MSAENGKQNSDLQKKEQNSHRSRPLLFSALCSAVLFYSVLMVVLFLAGIIKSRWLTGVLTDFFPDQMFSHRGTLLFTFTGLVLHAISITGIIFLIMMRRIGLYIYGFANLMFIIIPYIFGSGNITTSIIYLTVLILFVFFYKKLR